jgi:long-chain fatty acid transport protein
MRGNSSRLCCDCIALLLFAAELVFAQTAPNPPKTPQLTTQFNFSPPGARSLGMGASFIALADDATASESNPAGLVILAKPEISAHFRLSSFYNEFPNTVSEQGSDRFKDGTTSASFFSFVYPRGRTAFSVYYQQPGNFKSHSQFCCDSAALEGFQNTDSSNSRFRLENIGASGAVRLGSRLSVGGSIRQTRLNVQYGTFTIFTTCIPVPGSDPPQCPIDQSIRVERTIDDSDSKVTFNGGILLDLPNRFSVGFVYKQGAQFDVSSTDVFAQNTHDTPPFSRTSSTPQPFKIPDSFGAGIKYRPNDQWVLLADVVHITYSDLFTTTVEETSGRTQTLRANDATEFHAGTEYILFLKETPISIRTGFFTDPDHDLFPTIDSGTIHFTFGGGIVIHGNLQIDAAANLSRNTKEGVFSFVQRF